MPKHAHSSLQLRPPLHDPCHPLHTVQPDAVLAECPKILCTSASAQPNVSLSEQSFLYASKRILH